MAAPQGLARQQDDLRQKLNKAIAETGPKMRRRAGQGRPGDGQAQKVAERQGFLQCQQRPEQRAGSELRKGADALAKEMQAMAQQPASGQEDPLGRGNGPRRQRSSFPMPMIWRGRATFCRNCAGAPANAAARRRNWIISTGCSRNSEASERRRRYRAERAIGVPASSMP